MSSFLFALLTGVSDVRRILGRAGLLALQTVIVVGLLGLGGAQVASAMRDLQAADRLASSNAAYFIPRYSEGTVPLVTATPALRAYMTEALSTRGGYTVQRWPSAVSGKPMLIVYGTFFEHFDLGASPQTGQAALGANVLSPGLGGRVSLGVEPEKSASVVRRLPMGSGWLDPWMGFASLDGSVVIQGDLADLPDRSPVWGELLARLVIPAADSERLADHVRIAAETGALTLVPRTVADKIRGDFKPELDSRLLFVCIFGAAVAAALLGTVAGLTAIVRARRRAFAVHRLLGASRALVTTRIGAFVAGVWLIPAWLVMALTAWLLPRDHPAQAVFPWLVVGSDVLGAIVLAWGAQQVLRLDPMEVLKE